MDSQKPKTVLLGLDSFDWQIIEPLAAQGELPNLSRLKRQGASGNLTTLRPSISPILWNSIATGKRAGKHGIHGFTEVDANTGCVRPVSSLSRNTKAIWNILMEEGFTCHVFNWFASHPAEPLNGSCVSDAFLEAVTQPVHERCLRDETIYPPSLQQTMEALLVGIEEIPLELIQCLVPNVAQIDQSKDRRIYTIGSELAKMFSTHAAATWVMENQEWDFVAAYWRTPDLLKHHFMPFHPPAVEGINSTGAELYKNVINGVYRLFDQVVGRYLQLAPEDANFIVVSDHGFESGDLRPDYSEDPFANPEAWHREQGVFLARSPLIKKDSQLSNARLLDIAPTILTLNGVQPAADMDGRVLTEIFADPPNLNPVTSYEDNGRNAGQHPDGKDYAFQDADKMIQQFVDLGYIEPLDNDAHQAAKQTELNNKQNLARDYLDEQKPGLALPLLEELHEAAPKSVQDAVRLAYAQRQLGLTNEAQQTIDKVSQTIGTGPQVALLQAEICLDRNDTQAALTILETVARTHPDTPVLQGVLGRTYLMMRQYDRAEACLNRVLAIDPNDARAIQGLANIRLKTGKYERAMALALKAINLKPDLYYAHYYLGRAAYRLGLNEEAIHAFNNSLFYGPRNRRVHLLLAKLLQKQGNDIKAQQHVEAAETLGVLERDEAKRLKKLREQVVERARQRRVTQQQARAEIVTSNPECQNSVTPLELTLVSGVPRSGTSLMMQILEKGGLEPFQDGKRVRDENNPEGYYEVDQIKRLKDDPDVLSLGSEKATKVISMLLPSLPKQHRYKVVYMRRDPSQVASSQARMLERLGKANYMDLDQAADMIHRHDVDTLTFLKSAKNIDYVEVHYQDLVHSPQESMETIKSFLGDSLAGNIEQMTTAIKPDLWRER